MTTSHAASLAQASETANHEMPDVYRRLGNLTRTLHQALSELGYDKNIASAVESLPDARTRLAYIAKISGDSANRTLGAVERATQRQNALALRTDEVEAILKKNPAQAIASGAILQFIQDTRGSCEATNAELTDILMAQDFHDLTGQVINKVVVMAQSLEIQLVQLLVEAAPQSQAAKVESSWLNGPVVDSGQRVDVIQNQAQVDDLLESLGF
jgi:chemotaxis protein CheZ